MNSHQSAQQQAQSAGLVQQNPINILISALAASTSAQTPNGVQQPYAQDGHGASNAQLQQASNGDPTSTSLALDQLYGHSGFSRALSTANSTPAAQLITPFHETLLQTTHNQQHPFMPATPIQQTRSGRISRPPMAQTDLLRVLAVLNQPGMEVVRSALETTGMFNGYSTQAPTHQQGAVGQLLLAVQGQSQSGQAGQVQGQNQSVGFTAQSSTNGKSKDKSTKGRKRAREGDNEPISQSNQPQPQSKRFNSEFGGSDIASPAEAETAASPSANAEAEEKRECITSKPLTAEEKAALRRERNKISALEFRKKKKMDLEAAQTALASKEQEVVELTEKCERLERELEHMRQTILTLQSHPEATQPSLPGLISALLNPNLAALLAAFSTSLNTPAPTQSLPQQQPQPSLNTYTNLAQTAHPGPSAPIQPTPESGPSNLSFSYPQTFNYPSYPDTSTMFNNNDSMAGMETNADTSFDFGSFLFNMEDEEADGDFQPETSPHRGSDTDGEREGDGDGEGPGDDDEENDGEGEEDDTTPVAKRLKRSKRAGSVQLQGYSPIFDHGDTYDQGYDEPTPAESAMGGGGDEEDFIDPEMEDEDLFLPIEDVPVPPPSSGTIGKDVTAELMRALKVDTRVQLAAVMQKLVDSAGEAGGSAGVAPEVVEKIKNVMMMAQTQADQRAVRGLGVRARGGLGDGMGSSSTVGSGRTGRNDDGSDEEGGGEEVGEENGEDE